MTIDRYAMIAPNSAVFKDEKPNTLVAGVTGKLINEIYKGSLC